MERLVAIVGPTGVGKSRLALHLAQLVNGEIVNADSRQIYRQMNIGTAKPTQDELKLVHHYLIDIINPSQNFSLAQYQKLAQYAINDIFKRGKVPFLVGGTGQYVWSVLEGWVIPEVAPNLDYRRELEKKAAEGGAELLYQKLLETDPAAAQKIDKRNVRRVIRALEVVYQTSESSFKLRGKKVPEFNSLIIGLTASREELYRRVDTRVDEIIKRGLVAEVNKLIGMGCGLDLPAMSSIGYKQIGEYIKGAFTLEEATKKMKTETHRVIRHQYAWFRLSDNRIHWFDIEKSSHKEISDYVSRFLVA